MLKKSMGQALVLYVYNLPSDSVRPVVVFPHASWEGASNRSGAHYQLLGCGIVMDAERRLPLAHCTTNGIISGTHFLLAVLGLYTGLYRVANLPILATVAPACANRSDATTSDTSPPGWCLRSDCSRASTSGLCMHAHTSCTAILVTGYWVVTFGQPFSHSRIKCTSEN